MDHLFDSLSEEWISQPRCSDSPSAKDSSPRGNSSHTSNASQSRIPRFKQRSTSDDTSHRRALAGEDRDRAQVLAERTQSRLNASNTQAPQAFEKQNHLPHKPEQLRSGRRHTSTTSLPSVQHGTVQYRLPRTSPAGDENIQGTPDWKRRILNRQMNAGEQRDLFSPIGLESVFKPPTTRSKPQKKPNPKLQSVEAQDFPSSPPPYPSALLNSNRANSRPRHADFLPTLDRSEKFSGGEENSQARDIGGPGPEPEHNISRKISTDPPNEIASTTSKKDERLKFIGHEEERPLAAAHRDEHANDESILPNIRAARARQRQISEGDELRNEKISPLFVSRHNTVDGQIDYAALDASVNQLRAQIDNLDIRQQDWPSSHLSDHDIDYTHPATAIKSPANKRSTPEMTSISLPDDLSVGTDAFALDGKFVNVHRGGYSTEGSFLKRPLSPSSLPLHESTALASPESVQIDDPKISKGFSNFRGNRTQQDPETNVTSTEPRTPSEKHTIDAITPDRPRSSGSPLKLFDKYDTYTNDRLIRRMSQFEESLHHDSEAENSIDDNANNDQVRTAKGSPEAQVEEQRSDRSQMLRKYESRRISFGDGGLDGHQFSHDTVPVAVLAGKHMESENEENQPPLPELQHRNQSQFKFELDPADIPKEGRNTLINCSSKAPCQHVETQSSATYLLVEEAQNDHDTISDLTLKKNQERSKPNTDGKRVPNSPLKDSRPKRRRTLHGADEPPQNPRRNSQQQLAQSQMMPSIIGKKRKDARYDEHDQKADPEVIAMRQILRPRNPTPSQARHLHRLPSFVRTGHDSEDVDVDVAGDIKKLQEAQPSLDAPTQVLAGELANFALDVAQDITSGTRKASVTTADFFSEAQAIMQHIRAQRRPQSGLTSVDESETEKLYPGDESSASESTRDEFSRPPSREGGSLRGLRKQRQLDSGVIDYLHKYEENDDLGLMLSSSLKSLHVTQQSPEMLSLPKGDNVLDQEIIESDPPNMRILGSVAQVNKRKHSSSPDQNLPLHSTERYLDSRSSHPSSGPSTSHSIPTGSSGDSSSRAVIPPQKVSHLLSGQIAGMTFDRTRQVWIKKKGSKTESKEFDSTGSEETEEDPLQGIPDLSVDELEERNRMRSKASSLKATRPSLNGISSTDQADALEDKISAYHVQSEKQQGQGLHTISERVSTSTKSSNRSWKPLDGNNFLDESDSEREEEEVEHEISILEGRSYRTPPRSNQAYRQPRVVTVAFSSPLIRQSKSPDHSDDGVDHWEDNGDLDWDDSPEHQARSQNIGTPKVGSLRSAPKANSRHGSRRISTGSHTYQARPISRIDEEDEVSFPQHAQKSRNASMHMVLSTPKSLRDFPGSMSMPPPATGQRTNLTFHLSPLPDFTVHQTDESFNLDASYIAQRRGLLTLQEVDNKFSLTAQDLVKKITDVEPYEPYWEYIRKLELRKRDLLTLYMLDDFCGRIEELDVSDNELGQLNGVPSSIRCLDIRRNCLSNLTAWGHLYNLQYLDISGNNVQSLRGFSALVHLRELKADENQIETLDGIFALNGLLSLRLRQNLIKCVDFEGSDL